MRNIALTLQYLGTAYHGWQVQKTVTTVGQTLEEAAAAVVGHPVHMTGCGRTDAGVHARVYVANFRTTARIPCDRLPYALNTHLPEDIVVTNAMEVHDDFNAIGSCVRKEYTYLIYNSGIRDPFYVNRAWFYPKHLDETVMQRAAQQFRCALIQHSAAVGVEPRHIACFDGAAELLLQRIDLIGGSLQYVKGTVSHRHQRHIGVHGEDIQRLGFGCAAGGQRQGQHRSQQHGKKYRAENER